MAELIVVAMSWLRVIIKAACTGVCTIIAKPVAVGYMSFTSLISHNMAYLLPEYVRVFVLGGVLFGDTYHTLAHESAEDIS
jgi:hypothetical protein